MWLKRGKRSQTPTPCPAPPSPLRRRWVKSSYGLLGELGVQVRMTERSMYLKEFCSRNIARLLLVLRVICMLFLAANGFGLGQQTSEVVLDTGRDFLQNCQTSGRRPGEGKLIAEQFCKGYIYGFLSRLSLPNSPACFPKTGVGLQELHGSVIHWLETHADRLREPTPTLILAAWKETYPCGDHY